MVSANMPHHTSSSSSPKGHLVHRAGLLKSRRGMKKTSQSSRMKVIKSTFMKERLVMDYTTLLSAVKESQDQGQKHVQSLYAVCQQVVDGRAARGKPYALAGSLLPLMLAKRPWTNRLLAARRRGEPPAA